MISEPRIAFVIDALPSLGGAEKVLFTALEVFPQADVFTLVYNRSVFSNTELGLHDIKVSFIDRIPYSHQQHRLFLPLMPFAIERFDLRDYEVIFSFSYAVAHGARVCSGARHISYTFTPMRYAWLDFNLDGTRRSRNLFLDQLMRAFRAWDKRAAARVHQFVAISQVVSKRIETAYQREAEIIYPPVEVDRFVPAQAREDFFVTVTRLVPHKRVDILVQAFSDLGIPLIVIGNGPELQRLVRMAKPNIQFMGYLPDEEVIEILGKARAFVCAAEEDFGIAIVEAQAAGCPVIAYAKGGALETVLDGETGVLFSEQTPESLIGAIKKFERMYPAFHVSKLIENSHRYCKENFMSGFKKLLGGTK